MSNKSVNPVDIFFSKENILLLYETIQSYLETKYDIKIDKRYMSELIEVMKLVVMPIKRVPKDTDVKLFVKTLNQRTLTEAVPIFVKSIASKPVDTHTKKMSSSFNERAPTPQILSLPNGIPQPSYGGSYDDGKRQQQEIEELFNNLKTSNNMSNQKPPEIDFTKVGDTPQQNDPRFNVDVNDLYNRQTNYRQNGNDVALPPPSHALVNSFLSNNNDAFSSIKKEPIFQIPQENTTNKQSSPDKQQFAFSTPIASLISSTGSQFEKDMLDQKSQVQSDDSSFSQQLQNLAYSQTQTNNFKNDNKYDNKYENKYESKYEKSQDRNSSSIPMSVDNIYAQSEGLVPTNNLSPSVIFNPNQYVDITPQVNRDVTYRTNVNNFTDVAMSMYQYNPNAPQPQQLSTLIPKVSRNLVHDSRIIPNVVTVDSRDKDPLQTDNNYRIAIDEIKDVVSIELTDAQIPISEYVVNETNNIIYFEETDGVTLVAEITPGNYSAADLGTEIENQMNSVGSSTYTVAIDNLQNKFIINSNGAGGGGIFNLLFDGGTVPIGFEKEKTVYIQRSIGEVLGFAPTDLTGALTYTGQYTYNLKGEKYILLYVKEAELLKTRDSNVKNAFAKIVLDRPLGDTKFYSRNTDNQFIKYFSPPIGRLAYLTIEFRKQNGDYYNFNGQNNSLTFEIITKDITTSPYEYKE